MCAISGSSSLEKALKLYTKGLERGHNGSGALIIFSDDCLVFKQQKPFTEKDLLRELKTKLSDIVYIALHSRAPTNHAQKDWQYDTTHPFNFGTYYVSHNGIINNFKEFPEHSEFEVDSSIIPYHLQKNNGDIKKTYSAYTGLLTSWVYECTENKFNVVKAGSTLFIDEDTFCTVEFEKSKCVEKDGIIFTLTENKKLQETSTFDYTNPYFIL
jgi:hypothetical protein